MRASPTTTPYVEADLPGIVEAAADPPDGYTFFEVAAGENYAPFVFTLVPGQQGYATGMDRTFIPIKFADGKLARNPVLLDGAIFSGGWLFVDVDGAATTFALVAQDYPNRPTAHSGVTPVSSVPSTGLGDDSFGVLGSFVPGMDAYDFVLYAWRHANLVLFVLAVDAPGTALTLDPAQILRLAADMERRAASAARPTPP